MKSKFFGALVLAALATASFAADVTGKWEMGGITFDFKAEGEKLTGTASNGRSDLPVSDGTVKGDEIAFYLVRTFGGGNEIRIAYKGKVAGDVIKMSAWSVDNVAQVQESEAKRVK
jgi:opacity protein-like surface antigen